MSNILLFGDLHLNIHKESFDRLEDGIKVLEWVFETAIQRNIKNIIFLGDFFQHRQHIETLSYQRGFETVEKYMSNHDLNFYLLIGNHDMWFADQLGVSSVYPLGSIRNLHVINQCKTINIEGVNFDFLPFTLNPLKRIEYFFRDRNPSPVLCGHIAINGSMLNTVYKTYSEVSVEYDGDMESVNVDCFQGWKKVFLGHYHAEQRLGNIEYVGSPMQINFAEAFQQKHIIIFNPHTLESEYVINNFSPKHYIIQEHEMGNYDLKNSFVKVYAKSIDATELIDTGRKLLKDKEVLSLQVLPTKTQDDLNTKEIIEETKSHFSGRSPIEIFSHYINRTSLPSHISKQKFLEIATDIMQKVEIQ